MSLYFIMFMHIYETYLILSYLIAAIVSIVVALGLGLALLPKGRPMRFSFDKSALFPTPIFAIGFLAICFSINFFWFYDGLVLAVLWGIVAALFIKFGFDYVFPRPPKEGNIQNNSDSSLKDSSLKDSSLEDNSLEDYNSKSKEVNQ